MKKFFLMLAVALPVFFMTACGDDNDDLKDDFTIPVLVKDANDVLKFNNSSIYLEWDDDQADVKQAMKPYSYSFLAADSDNNNLVYAYDNAGATPVYTYSFVGNTLEAASITITTTEDGQINMEKFFKDNGYKDITTDEDDGFVYQSKDKVCYVDYGLVKGYVLVIWTPYNGTRANDRQTIYKHAEIVKNTLSNMGK